MYYIKQFNVCVCVCKLISTQSQCKVLQNSFLLILSKSSVCAKQSTTEFKPGPSPEFCFCGTGLVSSYSGFSKRRRATRVKDRRSGVGKPGVSGGWTSASAWPSFLTAETLSTEASAHKGGRCRFSLWQPLRVGFCLEVALDHHIWLYRLKGSTTRCRMPYRC